MKRLHFQLQPVVNARLSEPGERSDQYSPASRGRRGSQVVGVVAHNRLLAAALAASESAVRSRCRARSGVLVRSLHRARKDGEYYEPSRAVSADSRKKSAGIEYRRSGGTRKFSSVAFVRHLGFRWSSNSRGGVILGRRPPFVSHDHHRLRARFSDMKPGFNGIANPARQHAPCHQIVEAGSRSGPNRMPARKPRDGYRPQFGRRRRGADQHKLL